MIALCVHQHNIIVYVFIEKILESGDKANVNVMSSIYLGESPGHCLSQIFFVIVVTV